MRVTGRFKSYKAQSGFGFLFLDLPGNQDAMFLSDTLKSFGYDPRYISACPFDFDVEIEKTGRGWRVVKFWRIELAQTMFEKRKASK